MKKKMNRKATKVIKSKNEMSALKKLAYIFGTLLGLFLIFYGIAYLKLKNKETDTEEVSKVIQYDEILLSNVGKQSENEYYVVIYSNEEDYSSLYVKYINVYKKLDGALNVYYVDMNNAFNKQYISDTNNLKDINNLKINGDVLLKIKKGAITNSYVGLDAIATQLKTLANLTN